MKEKTLAVVILAAGKGVRMRSSLPKVMHKVCEKPMVEWVVDLAKKLKPSRIVVIEGHGKEHLRERLKSKGVLFAEQKEQLGTAHAVLQAEKALRGHKGPLLVLSGDSPLLTLDTAKALIRSFKKNGNISILTAEMVNTEGIGSPYGYGRIIRNEKGDILSIVEEKDATNDQKNITEANVGTYCFSAELLFKVLKKIRNTNKQKEYYLTDAIGIIQGQGLKIGSYQTNEWQETLGANSRREVVFAHNYMRNKIIDGWLDRGVTIYSACTSYIGPDVQIGNDTEIMPYTLLEGSTAIGSGCVVGPYTMLRNTKVGDNVQLEASYIRDAVVMDTATTGPYTSIRAGTIMGEGARAGSFVELKNSTLGKKAKVPHLSYIGDSELGNDVNIGAGSITCNYDGKKKSKTIIGDGAFIGSDTMFVAPVKVGKGAVTGAGSVITKDVPDGALALERSDQKIVTDWGTRRRSGSDKPALAKSAKVTNKAAKAAKIDKGSARAKKATGTRARIIKK